MRIYGNRQLKTMPGQAVRPTPARVREALFNIWQGNIVGCRWLDICAGNGAMGAEALCRDAAEVIGIERHGKTCHIIKENWHKVAKPEQKFRVIRGDAIEKIKDLSQEKFDRIYFDPPYASNLYQPVLDAIVKYRILAEDGEIAVEHDPKIWSATIISGLEIYKTKLYGRTALTFYRLKYCQEIQK